MPEPGYKKRRMKWTREELIGKVVEWVELYGDTPSAADWNASDLRGAVIRSTQRAALWGERLDRFNSGDWPWTGTVYKEFGGWNALIDAAGEIPRPAHGGRRIAREYAPARLQSLTRQVEQAQSRDDLRASLHKLAAEALAMASSLDDPTDIRRG